MDNNQENKSIQIMLPNMLNYTAFQDEIRNDFSQSKLNVEFNKFIKFKWVKLLY